MRTSKLSIGIILLLILPLAYAAPSDLSITGTLNASAIQVGTTNVCESDGTNCPAGASAPSTGLTNQSVADGDIVQTNTAANLTLGNSFFHIDNTNNRTGMGTNSPTAILHVIPNGSDVFNAFEDGMFRTGLLLQNNASENNSIGISLISGHTAGNSQVNFGDKDGEFQGRIIYQNLVDRFSLRVSNTEEAILHAAGFNVSSGNDFCISGGACLSTVSISSRWTAGSGTLYNSTVTAVGIGTSTPTEILHIESSQAAATLLLMNNTNVGAQNTGLRVTNSADNVWDFRATTSGDATISLVGSAVNELLITASTGQVTLVSTNNPGLLVGDGSTGYITVGNSDIYDAAGDLTLDSDTGVLDVAGGDNFTVDTNILFVDSTNNRVGIGTAAPSDSLEIEGAAAGIHIDSSDTADLLIDRSAANRGGKVRWQTAGGSVEWSIGQVDSDEAGDGTEFYIDSDDDATDAHFWIETNGNTGMGTTTPHVELEIASSAGPRIRLNETDGSTFQLRSSSNNFLIADSTNGLNPFTIEGGTATNTLYLASNSNVGINTTAPQDPLHINRTQATIRYSNTDNPGAWWRAGLNNEETFVINYQGDSAAELSVWPDGNVTILEGSVGIGSRSLGAILYTNTTSTPPEFERGHTSDGSSSRSVLSLTRSYPSGAGADGIGAHIDLYAETETEGVNDPIAQIRAVTTDATQGTVDSDISLRPYLNGAAVADAFIIKSTGRVGIGNATPSTLFEVESSASNPAVLIDQNANAPALAVTGGGSGQPLATFTRDGSHTITIASAGGDPYLGFSPAGDWYVGVDDSDSDKFSIGTGSAGPFDDNDFLTITTTGYVGINDTNPVATLDVSGTVSADNWVRTVNGAIYSGGEVFYFTTSAGNNKYISTSSNDMFFHAADSTAQMMIDGDADRIGIGTSNPSGRVQIDGHTTSSEGALVVNEKHTLGLLDNIVSNITNSLNTGDGYVSSAFKAVFNGSSTGFAYTVIQGNKSDLDNATAYIEADGSAFFGGDVSVGTKTPLEKVTINGSIQLLEKNHTIIFNEEVGSSTTSGELITSRTLGRLNYEARARHQFFSDTNDNDADTNPHITFYVNDDPTDGTADVADVTIMGTGHVGIGTESPGSTLEIEDTGTDNDVLLLDDSDTGACEAQPGSGSLTWSCSSDSRLKKNIRDAPSGLKHIQKFRVREYEMIEDDSTWVGVVAQEVEEIYPKLVTEGNDGYLMVSEPNPWYVVKAIQELETENDLLRTELCKRDSSYSWC